MGGNISFSGNFRGETVRREKGRIRVEFRSGKVAAAELHSVPELEKISSLNPGFSTSGNFG